MPNYAYKCDSCGHQQDVLQKMSDPLLTLCPACGAQAFAKQVTAAGFQLKGSGWYVTDFRAGNSGPAKKDAAAEPAAEKSAEAASDKQVDKPVDKPVEKSADKPVDKPVAAAAAAPAKPASGS